MTYLKKNCNLTKKNKNYYEELSYNSSVKCRNKATPSDLKESYSL